ncbi:MAG: aldehyde dehydrogenase family protein [Ignavibacteria bacterium]
MDVLCPLDGKVISTVPLSGKADLDEAVRSAAEAYQKWSLVLLKKEFRYFIITKHCLKKILLNFRNSHI